MTKEEFKRRWESDANGGGITPNDIANCAEEWRLFAAPRTQEISTVLYAVLKAAGTEDAEEFAPESDDE